MFKNKLIYKTTAAFMGVALSVILAFGAISIFCAARNYKNSFTSRVGTVVEGGLANTAQGILSSAKREFVKQYELDTLIRNFSADMGLDENRRCYILSVPGGEIVAPSCYAGDNLIQTQNLVNALQRHIKSSDNAMNADIIDYAYYFKTASDSPEEYVIYIKDNKTDQRTVTRMLLWIMLWLLIAGGLLAAAAAVYTARSVTQPLRKLSRRADSFAKGVYDLPSDTVKIEEIGSLTRAFNHMGSVMSETIGQIGAEKHKVDVILEHITNGIMAFDTQQRLIHMNPAAAVMLDIDPNAVPDFDEFFSGLDAGVCMAEFMYLDKDSSEIRDITYSGKHIRIYFVPFKMDNDRTAGVVCVFEDFTEQFNLEVARREFVAEVSHELKTPLFIIKTHTETLLNGYLDDKKLLKKFLTTIESEADKMTELVRNLLDLSKFDVQKFEMKKQVFSIDEMLRGIVGRFALEAERDSIDLSYLPANELPQMYADPTQIERAIVNIVSNAIKYGGNKVTVAAGSVYNNVYIKVEDNGTGIPKSDLEHVFDRFFRVDRARTRDKGGTGLGLSISKEIIESHGGSILIESEYGRFTRVTINLPTANGVS